MITIPKWSSNHTIAAIILLVFSCGAIFAQSEHTIQKGETLYSIARMYGLSITDLQNYNNIEDPRKLLVGQAILIPSTYTVKKGDTLYGIARMYDSTVGELRRMNDLSPGAVIKPDQILLVPGGVDTVADNAGDDAEPGTPTAGGDTLPAVRVYKQPEWPVNAARIAVDDRISGAAMTAEEGDSVVAIASGTVIWNAPFRGYGWMIIIESTDRYVYVYGGNEQALVDVGDKVVRGAEIATLGTNPHSGEATLFFSVYRGGKIIDPAKAPRI